VGVAAGGVETGAGAGVTVVRAGAHAASASESAATRESGFMSTGKSK
jgi:hypothetical protein